MGIMALVQAAFHPDPLPPSPQMGLQNKKAVDPAPIIGTITELEPK